jgi:hypothetical protein
VQEAASEGAILVVGLAAALQQEVVEQGGGGAGVEGDDGFAIEVGDIGDAAEVQDHERLRERGGQRLMVERGERRALPARGDVGVAEAVDHVDSEHRGHARAAAELAGEAGLGLVEHGLAVDADEVDGVGGEVVVFQEQQHGAGMGVADLGFQFGEGVVFGAAGVGEEVDQLAAQGGGVGVGASGAGFDRAAAVGADQGDVDRVHRGTAHHADRGG